MKSYSLLFLFIFSGWSYNRLNAQVQHTVPSNGPADKSPDCYALTHATVHITSSEVLKDATLLIEKGKVVAVGARLKLPACAVVMDMKGYHIYPSFIDLYASYGIAARPPATGLPSDPQYESLNKGPVHWNESIHPETRAVIEFIPQPAEAAQLRQIGFGTVLTHRMDGLMRGTAALVSLRDENTNLGLLKSDAAMMLSLEKGSSRQAYPSSLMGNIALLRQTFYDARWYHHLPEPKEKNIAYEALWPFMQQCMIMQAGDKYNILRAQKIAGEFNLNCILTSSGNEYQCTEAIKKAGVRLIVPLNFPDVYDVNDVYDAERIPLSDLMHWEWAPFNPARLYQSGIPFCLTVNGITDKKDWLSKLRLAVKCGLPNHAALDALTRVPAMWMGVYNEIGSLENGKWASFIVTSDDIFNENARITENWVQGEQHLILYENFPDINGVYVLTLQDKVYEMTVNGTAGAQMGDIKKDTLRYKADINHQGIQINIAFLAREHNFTGAVRLSGTIQYESGLWNGNASLPGGQTATWSALRKERENSVIPKTVPSDSLFTGKMKFPFKAYGFDSLPDAEPVMVFQHATIWTNENEGVLTGAEMVVKNGRIAYVGKPLAIHDKNAIFINAAGKHITPGIIDEHSHIAISGGVNEGGQANSAEVSIAQVVNADDINIYRQLAGGVTTSQLLHGSANPIGGQSAIIKLRWGKLPDEMVFAEAPGFIKFALGENVKQSNWGEEFKQRYPQSRMGVEQTYYDAFYRAKNYRQEWETYRKSTDKNRIPPRIDLEMDALVEILNKQRFITCHSYVQSEINMLMHVADSMNFTVNTFTHVLEGYKVAEKMAAHGASGCGFSDWWAYKFEVYEAIPYNSVLMQSQGVNTGINSDDAEMGRRLNQEAAKAVKYGGMSPENALKLVTLNPAKMLHIDHLTGSLLKGKQADFVVWSGHPLSVYSYAVQTYVDGICYFDISRDSMMRKEIAAERERIIAKMMAAKKSGAKSQSYVRKRYRLYHCDSMKTDEDEN